MNKKYSYYIRNTYVRYLILIRDTVYSSADVYTRYKMHIVFTVLQQVLNFRPFSVVNMTREGKNRTTFKVIKRLKGVYNLDYHILKHMSHLNELQHFILRPTLILCRLLTLQVTQHIHHCNRDS